MIESYRMLQNVPEYAEYARILENLAECNGISHNLTSNAKILQNLAESYTILQNHKESAESTMNLIESDRI